MFQILFIFFNLLLMTTASCPAGSIQGRYSNECYQIYSMPNDWASAEEMCSNYNNGHLTSVADIFDNSFIHNEIQILDYKAVEVWIGGNTLFVPGSWTWSDKTSFIYTNWAPGQPSTNINSCMSFNQTTSRWYSRDCNNQLPFVCRFLVSNSFSSTSVKPRLSTLISPPPTGVCPSGYQYFSGTGYCYGYYATKSDWSSSETYCANNSGHLASIHSYQEDNFVRNLFGLSNDPWLGLHYVNNQWIYTDGTAYDYTPANSLPNDYATNPCADMHQAGYWNNVGCNMLLERVCKIAPLTSVKPSTIKPTPTGVCPSGYQYFSGTGYCYGYILQTAYWNDAEIYCTNNGGHLASIHSYQEDNFIRNLFSSNYDPWIGLHYVNNQWIYTDGTAYDYSPANSLPKNYTYYPCADIHQAGYFNNVGCNEFSLTSVCKVAPLSNKKI